MLSLMGPPYRFRRRLRRITYMSNPAASASIIGSSSPLPPPFIDAFKFCQAGVPHLPRILVWQSLLDRRQPDRQPARCR